MESFRWKLICIVNPKLIQFNGIYCIIVMEKILLRKDQIKEIANFIASWNFINFAKYKRNYPNNSHWWCRYLCLKDINFPFTDIDLVALLKIKVFPIVIKSSESTIETVLQSVINGIFFFFLSENFHWKGCSTDRQ